MKTNFVSSLMLRSIGALRKLSVNFTGLLSGNRGKSLIDFALRLSRVVTGNISKGLCRSIAVYIIQCNLIRKKQGIKGLVRYLKCAQVLLMKIHGGDRPASTLSLGCNVARDNKGYPRMIHTMHRKAIRGGDTRLLRLWMSLFGLYRVLEFPGKFSFESITSPCTTNLDLVNSSFFQFLHLFFTTLSGLSKTVRALLEVRVENSLRAMKFLASREPVYIPTSSPVKAWEVAPGVRPNATSFPSLLATTEAMYAFSLGIPGREERTKSLWDTIGKYGDACGMSWVCAYIKRIWMLTNPDSDYLRKRTCPEFQKGQAHEDGRGGYLGSLTLLDEPAGKIRVVAMLDPFTQWMLYPLHKFIFSVLKEIPQDGTYNQMRPLDNLFKIAPWSMQLASMDLTAATDRLPVIFQQHLVSYMFGERLGALWRKLLTDREYVIRDHRVKKETALLYGVGQPMGAYSSWALLALFHHFIVQWAAFRVSLKKGYTYEWYPYYAVLGDDVVIGGKAVIDEYQVIMSSLGAPINLAKSISGHKPVAEFAKKFVVYGENVSPVSWKEVSVASRNFLSALWLKEKNPLMTLGGFLSVVHVGNFAKTKISKPWNKLSLRLENYIAMFHAPMFKDNNDYLTWFLRTGSDIYISLAEDELRNVVLLFAKDCAKRALEVSIQKLGTQPSVLVKMPKLPADYDEAPKLAKYLTTLNGNSEQIARWNAYSDYSEQAFALSHLVDDPASSLGALINSSVQLVVLANGISVPQPNPYVRYSAQAEVKIKSEMAHSVFQMRRTFQDIAKRTIKQRTNSQPNKTEG